VKAAREFNPHQRIPEFPNSREVGPVQRTIYPAEYSRIDRITLPAMIAVLLATLAATLTAVGAWSADQRLLRCGTVFRGVVATLLMVASVWVATVIQAAIWLKTPGAYGPVQYWHSDETAMAFINGPRVLSLFLMLGGFWLATLVAVASVVSLFFPSVTLWRRGLRLIVPGLAVGVYVLAWHWFVAYEFFPSA